MYPKLADETPRLAFVGATVTVVTAGAVALLFGLMLLSSVGPSSGDVVGIAPPGFAVLWLVILAVTPFYGADLPGWLALAVYGPMLTVLLATGFQLRSETPWTDRDTSPSTLTTG